MPTIKINIYPAFAEASAGEVKTKTIMETKKNPVHNLEKRYSLRLFAGLAVAVSITLVAFEWRTPFEEIVLPPDGDGPEIIYEYVPVTEKTEKKKEDKPEEIKKKVFKTDDFKISDKKEIENEEKKKEVVEEKKEVVFVSPLDTIKLPDETGEPEIFKIVEEMPKFKCSDDPMLLPEFILSKVKYPQRPKELGISGTSYIEFIVDNTGKVTETKVIKGFDRECDAEALRVVKMLPDFCPGMQRGKKVPVRMVVPVKYELRN